MNKKLNTLLFIIVATVVNVIILLFLLAAGFFIIGRLSEAGLVNDTGMQIMAVVVLISSLVGAFAAYSRILKYISTKIDMEKYFHPLFVPKKK